MSQLKVDSLADTAGSSSVPIADVINGSAKMWVNFNGTGTVAIRADYNVSSITDNGTGDYTINFTTALADANYGKAGVSSGVLLLGAATTSTLRLNTYSLGAAPTDYADICVTAFR